VLIQKGRKVTTLQLARAVDGGRVKRRAPRATAVYDTYWRFAAERQRIFHRRVLGEPGPWTGDPILAAHRFTNAYRVADRVSQYLVREVAYKGDQSVDEVVFRVLLFKLFNKVSTWDMLSAEFGQPSARSFHVSRYDDIMTRAFEQGVRLYSAAYIMPAAAPGVRRKHLTHLELLRTMLGDRLPQRLADCGSMQAGYELLLRYRGIGPFLAYQLITDLNYTQVLEFSEMEFVMPGPGALSGIRKCFSDYGGYGEADLIRLVADAQEEEFESRGIRFLDLWGRRLQLIDCQNLFCEVDKYARVAHPDILGLGGRSQIKQRFQPAGAPLPLWFPPKWGLNDRLPVRPLNRPAQSTACSDRQLALPLFGL
jgi:hypothetical protein